MYCNKQKEMTAAENLRWKLWTVLKKSFAMHDHNATDFFKIRTIIGLLINHCWKNKGFLANNAGCY